MGLNARFLQIMIWLREQGHVAPGAKVVEIGAQQLNNAFLAARPEIESLARLYGVPTPQLPQQTGDAAHLNLHPDAPRAAPFYRALGFDYACIDIDNSPGSIALDLNFDALPEPLRGKFNLVTNFGTTEHVLNQFNAFKIIHELAAPGAIMLHELPASGLINHGFFGYQPSFFTRLASANEYTALMMDFGWSAVEYGLSEDMQRFLDQYVDTRNRPPFGTSQCSITAVLRKNSDAAFVPPIDVPYGSSAPNEQMKERYGIAFKPLPFRARVVGKVLSTMAKVKRRLNS
jgi:Methyltransferase domain